MSTQRDKQRKAADRIGNDATRTQGSDADTFRESTAKHTREPPEPPSGVRPDLGGEQTHGNAGGVGKSL